MSNRNNFPSDVWGPHAWFFIDSIALGFPENPTEQEKQSLINFLLSLKDLLPCGACRYHFSDYMDTYMANNNINDVVKNRFAFLNFIHELHNTIRRRNKSEPRELTDVFTYYQKAYMAKEHFENNKTGNKIIEKYDINELLNQFNPITLITGIIIGLIIYKLFSKYSSDSSGSVDLSSGVSGSGIIESGITGAEV